MTGDGGVSRFAGKPRASRWKRDRDQYTARLCVRETLNRLRTADGGAFATRQIRLWLPPLPSARPARRSGWQQARVPGKHVIRIIADPLTLPDTCMP
jgi:hypothetical protein